MPDLNLPPLWVRRGDPKRRVLWASSQLLVAINVVTSILLPAVVAILVNIITTKEMMIPPVHAHMEWFILAVVSVAQIWLLWLKIVGETPMPMLVVKHEQLTDQLATVHQQAEEQTGFSNTFRLSLLSARIGAAAIEEMESQPPGSLEEVFAQIMEPWLNLRTEVFWFLEGDALYNFAVYLLNNEGNLQIVFRSCDSRIQRTDRTWAPGDGHVGMCFARGRTLFSPDTSLVDDILDTGRSSDVNYYRSMASSPIVVNGTKRGVFIVTSSVPNQLEKEVHTPIVELIATLLAAGLKHCWERPR